MNGEVFFFFFAYLFFPFFLASCLLFFSFLFVSFLAVLSFKEEGSIINRVSWFHSFQLVFGY